MIANSQSQMITTGKPCGCGGKSSTGAAVCSCGACATQSFVRPNFFAGQLLTEDDLQSLASYVTAKNRLHNRHLFGEGVVCGFDVTCHPCADGQAVVHPGMALDCCGNDLILTCAKTLDINAMIRELRIKNLGYDCGDPCEEEKKPCDDAGKPVSEDSTTRHYCLYVRYCEEATDPVSPYSTGDDCGVQVCAPTRIREGVKFELRCREDDRHSDNLFTRLCECFGDLSSLERHSGDAKFNSYRSSLVRSEQVKLSFDRSTEFGNQLDANVIDLNKRLDVIYKNASAAKSSEKAGLGKIAVSEEDLRAAVTASLFVLADLARFFALTAQEQEEVMMGKDLQTTIGAAINIYGSASKLLNDFSMFPTKLEQLHGKAVFETGARLVQVNKFREMKAVSAEQIQRESLDQESINNLQMRIVSSPTFEVEASSSRLDMREWLMDRLENSPHLSDYSLRDEVATSRPPVVAEPSQWTPKVPGTSVRSGDSLARLFLRYLKDCFCSALNPPCRPCDDTAVLLACLEVSDCRVVRICNLERTYVLTPTAIRYWIPWISQIGETLEDACCPMPRPEYKRADTSGPQFIRPGVEPAIREIGSSLWPSLLSSFAGTCAKESDRMARTVKVVDQLMRGGVAAQLTAAPREIRDQADIEARAAKFSLSDLGPELMNEINDLIEKKVSARIAGIPPSKPSVAARIGAKRKKSTGSK